MQEFMIRLNSVQDVQDFVALATTRSFRITVADDNHAVNGTSFIELFCLHLNYPLTVTAECQEEDFSRLYQEAQRFVAQV